ncbi:MAG: endonuclease/exonuclease/phosphatase family protein [Myxococcota bacterium]|jgi:endonuclease/exonuclease/phosphatase family metal-dependent hydrolase|nr:endonuclease/exonuclease/phosphatase family protein [Myxococcota bacterium]
MIIYSWNICRSAQAWRELARSDGDIALLQEAVAPPADLDLEVDEAGWGTAGAGLDRPWRTAIARLSNRVTMSTRSCRAIPEGEMGQLVSSRAGTMTVADVELPGEEPITLVSMYAAWEKPATETGSAWIVADASAHRLISDLSLLIGRQSGHRIIAAGDLNLLYGYGENGSAYWARRYMTVFDRMEALGMRFVGPQSPRGAQADPWPAELPKDSMNVPTFRTRRGDPSTATRQLDFVFASDSLASRVDVTALNRADEWGPSDHCRIRVELT